MATINTEILNAAHSDGIFKFTLSKRQKIYFHPSVVTASEILESIRKSQNNGMNAEQLAKLHKLNKTTILQFCRWLKNKRLIQSETNYKRVDSGRSILVELVFYSN